MARDDDQHRDADEPDAQPNDAASPPDADPDAQQDADPAPGLREPEQIVPAADRHHTDDDTIPLDPELVDPAGDPDDATEPTEDGPAPSVAPVAEDTRPKDRAERAGYPPDHGEEQAVMKVRPAFFLPHLLSLVGLIGGPAFIAFVAWWVLGDEHGPAAARWVAIVGGGAAVLVTAGWWFVARFSYMLEITNKRTIEHIGLLSKTTDEVLHDHVRNVTIEQSFFDRMVNVGSIGIASAGHAGTEIEMRHVPRPHKVREIIDLYRPVG